MKRRFAICFVSASRPCLRVLFCVAGSLWLAWLCVACIETGDEREAVLRELFLADNRVLLERDPEMVASRNVKMTVHPYLFLRGTATVFWLDSTHPGNPGYLPTAYGNREASRVLITGDAHPENFGSYLNGDGLLLLDFNDFDTAGYGPWHLEVRRLALGWYVAGKMLEEEAGSREQMRYRLAEAAVRGYTDEIAAQVAGETPIRVADDEEAATIVEDLFRRARRDGDIAEELDDFTIIDESGRRVMFYGTVREGETEGVLGSEMVRVSPDEERMVEEIVRRWRTTILHPDQWPEGAFEVKGVARRLGAGVGSYAILRYYVLLEGPTDSPDDDWIIDVKEAVETTYLPGVHSVPRGSWSSAGERVVQLARHFQEFDHNDPLVGWASLGDLSFHVQDRTKYQKNLDVERFIDRRRRTEGGRFSDEDLLEVATLTGAVLARGHARAETLGGADALEAVAAAIGGDAAGVRDETLLFVLRYGPQVWSDFHLFREMVEVHGPLLGHRPARGLR